MRLSGKVTQVIVLEAAHSEIDFRESKNKMSRERENGRVSSATLAMCSKKVKPVGRWQTSFTRHPHFWKVLCDVVNNRERACSPGYQ